MSAKGKGKVAHKKIAFMGGRNKTKRQLKRGKKRGGKY